MLRLNHISDTHRFMSVIDNCAGSVLLSLQNGTTCDLKENPVARGFFQNASTAEGVFDLSFDNKTDMINVLRYVTEESLM